MNKLQFLKGISIACSVFFIGGCASSQFNYSVEAKKTTEGARTREVVSITTNGVTETTVKVSDGGVVVGSGRVKTEARNVSGFDSVDLRSSADVDWSTGPQYKVSVEADDNIIPMIKTELRGKTLVINMKGSSTSSHPIWVHVTAPHLVAINVAGSGNVAADDLTDNLALMVNGSGNITVTGKGEQVSVAVNGSGNVEAQNFKSHQAHVVVGGSGNANVYADQTADLCINGSGNINYAGKPKSLNKQVNGSGAVLPI